MKKNILAFIAMILLAQTSFAGEIGYVDIQKVVNSYPLAQKYKKEINAKFDEVGKYIKNQEKDVASVKEPTAQAQKKQQAFANVEAKQKEYLNLRKVRENEIDRNIKQVANKVRIEKKLDAIVKKDAIMAGGVDVTQDIINGLK